MSGEQDVKFFVHVFWVLKADGAWCVGVVWVDMVTVGSVAEMWKELVLTGIRVVEVTVTGNEIRTGR